MKKILLLLLLGPVALAQTPARYDMPVMMTTPGQNPTDGLPALLAVTNATVAVCGYPAVLSGGVGTHTMCTNTITTYTDSTLTTACPASAQLTAPGTSVCISTTGLQGAFGFWYNSQAQSHMTYTVKTAWGVFGPFDILPGGGSSLTLQHNSLNVTDQSLFNALDDGTIAPDAGYTLAKWLTNSTGGWAAEVPGLSGSFQMQVVPPIAGQYTIIYPTTCVASVGGSGDASAECPPSGQPQNSGYLTNTTKAPLDSSSSQTVYGGFGYPSYVLPANVTAIYPFAISTSYDAAPGAQAAFAGFSCTDGTNTYEWNPLGGVSSATPWPMQQSSTHATAFVPSAVATWTCQALTNASQLANSVLNVPLFGIMIFYSGTAPPVRDVLNLAGLLYLNPTTNTLSTGPTNLAITGDGGVIGLLPNVNLANPSMTINGTTCTLGSSCTPSGGGGTTTNPLTAATTGGAAPGTTFNGSTAVTFDYHSFGAPGISGTPASGNCVEWASANTLGDTGSPCGSGGGGALPTATLFGQVPVSSGAGTTYTAQSLGMGGRTVAISTDTIACTTTSSAGDRDGQITYNSTGAIAVTVPDPSTSGCGSSFSFKVQNANSGLVTFTRGTSATFTIFNGNSVTLAATSFALSQGQFATISSPDNTNWNVTLSQTTGTVTPSVVLISAQTLASAAPAFTFSSIPATYEDLMLRCDGRGDTAAASISALVTLNGDTSSNYDNGYIQNNNGGPAAGASTATSMSISGMPAASTTAGYTGGFSMLIHNYKNTSFYKMAHADSYIDIAATGQFNAQYGFEWKSTAAITSIAVTASAGNFLTGTRCSLYGSN